MARLSNTIEEFIKQLLEESEGELELQRNELAEHFQCAPSQINYVLSTRFTTGDGYVIESRRGGGGFIRITRIRMDPKDYLLQLVRQRLGSPVSRQEVLQILNGLVERRLLLPKEAQLCSAATSDQALSDVVQQPLLRDILRANVLRMMLLTLMQQNQQNTES